MAGLLEIDNLSVSLRTGAGLLEAIDSLDLNVGAGETVCLVGESGSGKTVTALSVLRLIDYESGHSLKGEVRLDGVDLAALSQREMSALRGRRIGVVFQDPMTAFDPVFTIGEQIAEVIVRHKRSGSAAARNEAIALLRKVRIPDAHLRVDQYPHQLSGGMRQRAMIAMALACGPDLLIADEPTTALDVTIQAQILGLLKDLQAETGMAILLITHDLGVAAQIADRVVAMYAGRIVEDAPIADLFARPQHPYTMGLLQSVVSASSPRGEKLHSIPGAIPGLAALPSGCRFHPRCPRADWRCSVEAPPLERHGETRVACWRPGDEPTASLSSVIHSPAPPDAPRLADDARAPLFEITDLHKHYGLGVAWPGVRRPVVRAVDGVSFHIDKGETFGLIGESGCGKSTLGRVLMQLERATSGHVTFDGENLGEFDLRRLRRARRDMQMIFQNPHGSVDPRWSIGDIIGEPLAAHEKSSVGERRARVRELLIDVGLDPAVHRSYPHQLSGGQCQRVAIARAIALRPRFVLADEAVSALDVSVQAQIVNLLLELKARLGLTYLFIGHGLHVVRHVSDRIGVMYLGRLVEVGPADEIFRHPAHPYTKALAASVLEPDPARRRERAPIDGEIPSPIDPPAGCRFHPRCPSAVARCRDEQPQLTALDRGAAPTPKRSVACHFPL